jgi:hypothetical protein
MMTRVAGNGMGQMVTTSPPMTARITVMAAYAVTVR